MYIFNRRKWIKNDLTNEDRLVKQNTFGGGGTLPGNLRPVLNLMELQQLNTCP